VIIAKLDPKARWGKHDLKKLGQINLKVRFSDSRSIHLTCLQLDHMFPEIPFRRCEGGWATKRCIMQYLTSLRSRDMTIEDAALEEQVDLSSDAVRQELQS
jgi:hypothetical protein